MNYDDPSSLVEALKGQEVLIITMGVMAPPDTQGKLIQAAAAAGVSWILPNEWGFDGENPFEGVLAGMRARAQATRELIASHAPLSYTAVTCGFWYEFSLSGSAYRYGFDFKNKTVVFIDDGTTKINTSSWPHCGKAVASLLSLKLLPDDESDKSPTLSQFRNDFIRVSSFRVSQKDMFASILRCTGEKESDWKVSYEKSKERYEAGNKLMQEGNREGFAQLMYTRVFYPDGTGDYESRKGLSHQALGLKGEDLDHYTQIAIDMAKEGPKYA